MHHPPLTPVIAGLLLLLLPPAAPRTRADLITSALTPAGGLTTTSSSRLLGAITTTAPTPQRSSRHHNLHTGPIAPNPLQNLLDTDHDGIINELDDDNDGDHMRDHDEIRFGYDPLNPANCLEITSLRLDAHGTPKLHWKAQPRKHYTIYRAESLHGPYEQIHAVTAPEQPNSAWQELEAELPAPPANTAYYRIKQHE